MRDSIQEARAVARKRTSGATQRAQRTTPFARRTLYAAAALFVGLGGRLDAHADCAPEQPRVIWSSPGAGEIDVPSNADLFLIVANSGLDEDVSVLLDEVELLPASRMPGHFELDELEAGSEHTVEVVIEAPLGTSQEGPTEIRWTFTTGSEPLVEPLTELNPAELSVEPSGLYETDRESYPLSDLPNCSEALLTRTCFDTGEPSLLSLGAFSGAAMYVFETRRVDPTTGGSVLRAVPLSCGRPVRYGYDRDQSELVHTAHAISRDGRILSSRPVLSEEARVQDPHVLSEEARGRDPQREPTLESAASGCRFAARGGTQGAAFGWACVVAAFGAFARLRSSGRRTRRSNKSTPR